MTETVTTVGAWTVMDRGVDPAADLQETESIW